MDHLIDLLTPEKESLLSNYHVHAIEVYKYAPHYLEEQNIALADQEAYGILRIDCAGAEGYAEFHVTIEEGKMDLVRWASAFQDLKTKSVYEALQRTAQAEEEWGSERQELAAAALQELAKNLLEAPKQTNELKTLERGMLYDCAESYYSF